MIPRIRLLGLLLLVSFFTLGYRVWDLQIKRHDEFAARADRQHFDTLELPAARGDILAADKTILAGSTPSFLLYAYKPHVTQDFHALSARLASVLGRDEQELFNQLSDQSAWIPIDRNVTIDAREEIASWNEPGLGFEAAASRSYPDASASAHVVGFVGKDEAGNPKGYFGLEGYYDRELRGVNGELRQEKDAFGNPILVGRYDEIAPVSGRTLETHIDRYVQNLVSEALREGLERYGASAGEAVVMNPATGAIVASASYPNYDPARFWEFPAAARKNPTVAETYEPGSTFKVLVMSAALDAGVLTPDTTCDICDGPIRIGTYLVRTWNEQYRQQISMTDTIVHSDNTGMVFVARRLGEERMLEYLRKFGIGDTTGIDVQEETIPNLRERWAEIDVATASFGQGIAVTTLQMLRAVGAIASGGVLMTPQIVGRISGDKEVEIEPKPIRRVISEETARTMTDIMVKAVKDGEAKFAAPKGYRIAGKTGTAQIPVAGHYDQEKTIVSFVGFAPADNPKFAMIVKLREPTSSPWGSETAAPLWFSIAKKLFLYWGIPPSEQ